MRVNLDEGEVEHMRIGELAERTGTPRRLLRYYEEQQLISPDRSANGYRDYDERLVDRVTQIRGLLDAGLPTRIIKQILPCLDQPAILVCADDASPHVIATLESELHRMSARIDTLTRNRGAITDYLDAARKPKRPHRRHRSQIAPSAAAGTVRQVALTREIG